ncbi:MAG: poly(R)-hydroxyalkanoic acid synthase subunit PhaE [Rhodanobacter sp.]
MADSTSDFMQDYQALARQSWDGWLRQMQAAAPAQAPSPFGGAASFGGDAIERTLDGLKGYMQWMQGATAAPAPAADWQQQLQQWFGGGAAPFAQAFGSIDSAGAQGFVRQWQDWLRNAGSTLGVPSPAASPTPAFGMDREQHMQQQALAQAMLAAVQALGAYQALLQRANAQGLERLQDKLAEHSQPGRQIDSLKALYDLWVDASEEAYAQIALTDEFRHAYGEMVNAQMQVRQLQQKQTEAMCQQMGVPTRSEVSSLGERLQALRRELRSSGSTESGTTDEIRDLRREVAALKRQLGAQASAEPSTRKRVAKRASPAASKRAVAKATKSAAPRKRKAAPAASASSKRAQPAAAKTRSTPRKRK